MGDLARRRRRLKIGFQVWGQHADWPTMAETARAIESLGFDSIWANDHFYPATGPEAGGLLAPDGPVFEGWMTLAGFAGITSRVRLGVLASAAGYRNPALLLKMATALDHSSGGRVTLGIGAGWHEKDHRRLGFEFLPVGQRIDRLAEHAEVLRGLLDGRTVAFAGKFLTVAGVSNQPPPLQDRMPLLIAGSGERRTLPIVARFADVWNGEGAPEAFRGRSRLLTNYCRAVGRSASAIRRTAGVPPAWIRSTRSAAVRGLAQALRTHGLTTTEARTMAETSPLVGTVSDATAALGAWQAAGADEVMIDWPAPYDPETLERLSAAIRPTRARPTEVPRQPTRARPGQARQAS